MGGVFLMIAHCPFSVVWDFYLWGWGPIFIIGVGRSGDVIPVTHGRCMFPVELVPFFYYHEKHEMTRKEGVMTWVLGIGFRFLFEDHLREWRAGSKGVFGMLWRYRLIPGRCQAVPGRCRGEGLRWCGDPQAHFANKCGFRQCKSGKNWLFCGEDLEQVARVSVHCKLVTRATQLDAYSVWGQGAVKSKFCSGANQR